MGVGIHSHARWYVLGSATDNVENSEVANTFQLFGPSH